MRILLNFMLGKVFNVIFLIILLRKYIARIKQIWYIGKFSRVLLLIMETEIIFSFIITIFLTKDNRKIILLFSLLISFYTLQIKLFCICPGMLLIGYSNSDIYFFGCHIKYSIWLTLFNTLTFIARTKTALIIYIIAGIW